MTKDEAKKEINAILLKIFKEDEVYMYKGVFVRWGKVEKDIYHVIDSIKEVR
jgi:hypothetical protein